MIYALRHRHHLIFRVLAVALPLLFLSALWARHAKPVNTPLPAPLTSRETR